MIKLTSTCAFVKPVSVDAFKTISLYMVPVPTIPSSKNRSKIPLCHLRYEYVSPLYFLTKNNYYLAGSLLEGTLCFKSAASDGSDDPDDHFTRVLPTFSIEKYRVLPYEKM